MRHPLFLLALLTTTSLLLGPLSAADWPEFLGPDRNGVSKETGLLNSWPSTGPQEIWNHKIGTGYSAPSIREGMLVVHHRVGSEEIVEARIAADGKPLWRYAYPSRFVDPYGYNNGPRCTPLLTADRCYTFGAEGKLLCLDRRSGKLIWQNDTAQNWKIPEAFFGVGSTPILEGDKLLVMVGGQPNSGVVAFEASTGKVLWESVGKGNWEGQPMLGFPGQRNVVWRDYDKQASYSTLVAATLHGKRHVFALMRQGLVSLDPSTGQVNFSRFFRSQAEDSVNAANPVVVGDEVFISGAYFRVGSVVLKVNPDGKSFTESWKSTALEIHWTTPIYYDGHLYAFSGRNEPDARFRCVEFKTGVVKWDLDQKWRKSIEPPQVYGRGSAILADGKLIVLGEAGLLGLFELNSKSPVELSRYQVPTLEYPCWVAPVLSNQKLYLRSEDRLICLDLKKP